MLHDPVEFMSVVKEDLFQKEVYVFSPKGEVLALAKNSSPIDFAYQIHSEVGNHCVGARVNGHQVPLSYTLHNGDTVEILTSPNQVPSRDWLSMVSTTKAKQRIRAWLKAEEQNHSMLLGKELLTKDLRKVKYSLDRVVKDGTLANIAHELTLKNLDSLYSEIGYGKITTGQIIAKILPSNDKEGTLPESEQPFIQRIFQKVAKNESSGVKVSGMGDMVIRFAKCCEPLPGDQLVGYITRGRGVAVHVRGCPETLSFDPQRVVPVSWEEKTKSFKRVRIKVVALDQVGLLASLTQSLSNSGVNIVSVHAALGNDGKGTNLFELQIENAAQLQLVRKNLEKIPGVLKVERHYGKEK